MRPVSEGYPRGRHLWLWPGVFVVLITLVLVAALLPWTKTEPGATLTSPASSGVQDAASVPPRKAAEDGASGPAAAPGTVDEAGSAPAARAVEDEASRPAPPPSSVESGALAPPAPDTVEDTASVPPPAPKAMGEEGSAPPAAPNATGKGATSLPAAPAAVEDGAPTLAQAPNIDQRGLLAALLRHGNRPEGLTPADYPGVDVLLATPLYFRFTGRRLPALDQHSIVFFVSEEVHIGELPALPPRPFLKIGRVYHEPVEVRMLTDSPHHRTTIVLYSAAWSNGSPIVTSEARSLEMVFPAASSASATSVLSWELPISYGPDYTSREVSAMGTARTNTTAAVQYASHTRGSASADRGHASSGAPFGFSYLQPTPRTLTPAAALLGTLSRILHLSRGYVNSGL